MKQLLLLFILFSATTISAQIAITQSDMPQPDDAFITTSAFLDLTIDPEETGAGFSWDFSEVIPLNSIADTFTDESALPAIYQFFFFGANLAHKTGYNISFDQFSLEDVYYVYKNSSSNLQLYGYAGTFSGIPIPIVYSSKDIVYHFPLEYGDIDSSDSGFEFGLPGVAFVSQERKRVNKVDGWGTIKTPVGTFDVLRVKSVITDEDSVFIDSLSYGASAVLTSYEYKWLTSEGGMPVFQINAQEVLGVPVITQLLYQDTTFHTAISTVSLNDQQVIVYPDPASDHIQVRLPETAHSSLQILATDASGKRVYTAKVEYPSYSLDISSWANGIYFLRMVTEKEVFHSRVIVQH